MELCANTSALRSYMRTVDQEERRLTAIENQTARLLLTEYSNSRTDVVMSALREMNGATCDAIAIHMGHIGHKRCAIEKSRHYEMIGRLIAGSIDAYCASEAHKAAEDEINNVACPHCFDAGCRRCREES